MRRKRKIKGKRTARVNARTCLIALLFDCLSLSLCTLSFSLLLFFLFQAQQPSFQKALQVDQHLPPNPQPRAFHTILDQLDVCLWGDLNNSVSRLLLLSSFFSLASSATPPTHLLSNKANQPPTHKPNHPSTHPPN